MSQYASARNRKSGCAAFVRRDQRRASTRPGGAGPARSPHVRAKTSLVISIAMSQRSPSHWPPIAIRVSRDGLAQRRREGVELRHVGPRGEVGVATLGDHAARGAQERLGVAREVLLGAGQQALGTRGRPRMVGGDVVGHVVEDHARGPARRAARAPPPARPDRRSARRRRSRARSRASRSRPRRAGRGGRRGWPRPAPGPPARSAGPPGCAARRPSARRRRRAAPRARPTRRRAPRRARAASRARGRGAAATPRC